VAPDMHDGMVLKKFMDNNEDTVLLGEEKNSSLSKLQQSYILVSAV